MHLIMSYQVLARKFRPGSFEGLVGQDHVVRALTHALDNDRLHHAYLFTGTRGVGKTTTTVNLAAALGVLEKKVLLIDADPQANASSGLGIDVESVETGTYQVLEHTVTAKEAIQKTNSPNVDIIPAHIDLVAIEIELVDKEQREYMLQKAIQEVATDYDYVLIDCAPSLGLITLNSLVAADSVIIPIQCEYFALEGLGKLLNTIKSVQKIHNPDLDIEGLLNLGCAKVATMIKGKSV